MNETHKSAEDREAEVNTMNILRADLEGTKEIAGALSKALDLGRDILDVVDAVLNGREGDDKL